MDNSLQMKVTLVLSNHPAPISSLCGSYLYYLTFLTSSFTAVIISMVTRDRLTRDRNYESYDKLLHTLLMRVVFLMRTGCRVSVIFHMWLTYLIQQSFVSEMGFFFDSQSSILLIKIHKMTLLLLHLKFQNLWLGEYFKCLNCNYWVQDASLLILFSVCALEALHFYITLYSINPSIHYL